MSATPAVAITTRARAGRVADGEGDPRRAHRAGAEVPRRAALEAVPQLQGPRADAVPRSRGSAGARAVEEREGVGGAPEEGARQSRGRARGRAARDFAAGGAG